MERFEMSKTINVLIVEDSEDDAALMIREIRRGSYDLVYERVETGDAMKEALERKKWDAIICDYALPNFSINEAFKIFEMSGLDMPFILVSGTIGEDIAVRAMKTG